jgi:hypothetical protein
MPMELRRRETGETSSSEVASGERPHQPSSFANTQFDRSGKAAFGGEYQMTWENYIDQAAAFDEANPFLYHALVERARELRDHGVRRFGITLPWERVRYDLSIDSGEEYKLNNNFRPVYARLIRESEPDLVDHLVIRNSASRE